MALTSANFGDLLEPGFREILFDRYGKIVSAIPKLFSMKKQNKRYYVKDSSVGAIPKFARMDGSISYADVSQGYDVKCEFEEFTQGLQIERKLFDDEEYNIMNKVPNQMSDSAAWKREEDAASLFNDADAAIPDFMTTTGDGVSLCNASHPYSPDDAGTQSNVGTSAMDYDTIVSTRRLMKQYKNDVREKISIQPDMLLVPLNLEETAWSIIESPLRGDTADNAANFHRNKWKLIVWDYLDDTNDWFMIASDLMKKSLSWVDRIGLEFFREQIFDTMIAKFAGYMRYGYYYNDWRWIYKHVVSGS